MAFLSGVLSNIYNHLGQHKETITPVIKILEEKKHAGKNGFNDAIGTVVEGVRKYNGYVKTSNGRVSDPIKALLTYFKTQNNGEFITGFNAIQVDKVSDNPAQEDQQVKNAADLVADCLKNTNKFNDTFDINKAKKNLKKDINDLNHELRVRVHSVRETVKYETDRLTTLSRKEKENYDAIVKMVNKVEEIKTCVKTKITEDITKLVTKLKKDVRSILNTLERISTNLTQYVKDLNTWIWEADGFVRDVLEKLEKILEEVDNPAERKKSINQAAEYIKGQAMYMHEAGRDAANKVQQEVTKALAQVKKMDEALKGDLKRVKDAIEDAVKALGTKLETNVKEDLTTLKGKITKDLYPIIRNSNDFLAKFSATKNVLNWTITQVESHIATFSDLSKIGSANEYRGMITLLAAFGKNESAFEKLANYIHELDRHVMTPLNSVIEKIGERFGQSKQHRQQMLTSELADGLRSAESDLMNFKALIDDNRIRGNLHFGDVKSELMNVLGMHFDVKSDLRSRLTNVPSNMQSFGGEIIENNKLRSFLTAVRQVVEAVSDHSKEVVLKVINKIKEKVRQEVATVAMMIKDKTQHIKTGIESDSDTLTIGDKDQLSGLEKLVNRFSEDIDVALQVFKGKFDNDFFKMKSASRDDYMFGADLMSNFHETYTTLHGGTLNNKNGNGNVINDEIGSTDDQKVKLPSGDKFKGYKTYVAQTEAALEGLKSELKGEEKEGSLPQAIGGIRTKVEEALEPIAGYKDMVLQKAEEAKSALADLCHAIKKAAELDEYSAKNKLNELRSKIGMNAQKPFSESVLKNLQDKLHALLTGDLNNAIKDAERFTKSEADKAGKYVIDELTKEVDDKLTESKKELTKQANTHYVITMQYLLEQFADKVRKQLEKLPEAIEDDLTIGFKGFMGAFQGQNGQAANYDNINKLKEIADRLSQNPTEYKENFEKLANKFQSFWQPLYSYLKEEIKRVHKENERIHSKPSGDEQLYTSRLDSVTNEFNRLLNHLCEHNKYDYRVPSMLDSIVTELDGLHPESFSEPNTPLLETIAHGFRGLVGELGKAYISAYDSETFGADLVEKEKLTPYGTKLSKVCLTVVSTSYNVLNTVRKYSGTMWRSDKIRQSTPIGHFLGNNGYVVSENKQDGQLRNGDGMLGWHVYKSLVKDADGRVYKHHDADKDTGPLKILHDCLETYYEVCHQSTFASKRQPSSVFEMLCWLCGLPCNSVYVALLRDTMSDLFEDPKKQTKEAGDDHEFTLVTPDALYLNAYPSSITYDNSVKAVRHLCLRSYDLLTAILGTGDAYSMYAVDFCSNSLNLHYPSKGDDCLQMLLDILRSLLPSLNFLRSQCQVTAEHRGWSDCWYGKGVQSSKSQCNDHSTNKSACQADGRPKCQAMCQPTSPLQSYLSDCLTGHLPHQVSSIGCKAKCATCPKGLPGQPCITPLGFRGFSGSMRTGEDLCKALTKFFVNVQYSSLLCLMPKPPSTLPEHYQFVSTLVRMLDNGKGVNGNTVKTAFEKATKEMSIELYKDTNDFTNALQKAYRSHGSSRHAKYSEADLSTLSAETNCTFVSSDKIHCAPYLKSLCEDSYTYLAEKHSKLYFSWALYLPLALHDYLKSLLDSFSNISCRDWGCSRCTHGTKCSRGKHGVENCQCRGLVECRGVSSTFYRYGFTFGDSTKLHGDSSKSYCHHFYIQLKNVLTSTYFGELFEKCDDFLFTIRQPFIWLNVALWSLSLFYLICVMVGRLDVLHIRSHLRIPSSHKITAQSLLAAAQVGRLAKISYLQP